MTKGAERVPATVPVAMGRELKVPRAAGDVCCFKFEELCGAAVGASDYIALVKQYHTVALKGVPIFTPGNRSMAYRFVTLIDVMYDNRTKLLVSSEGYPGDLFRNIYTLAQSKSEVSKFAEEMLVDDNLGFAKDRTVSRLAEMQTIEYAIAHAKRYDPALCLALEDARGRTEANH
jgi:peroxisome-assembly ATPase